MGSGLLLWLRVLVSFVHVHWGCYLSQKCLEEKNEILRGKLAQLQEQLAQLQNSPQKGEVLGDVLQVGSGQSSTEAHVEAPWASCGWT